VLDKLAEPVLQLLHQAALQQHVHPVEAGFIRNLASLARNTFTSLIAVILNILEEFTSPALTRALCLNPFEAPSRHVSVRETIEDGKWLVYSPSGASPAVETVGRALKSKFFEITFRRRNRLRPFIYACDEFHRFVTDDPESGEQNYLDRCRAFRAICVLATQSIASIRVGLSGSRDSPASALEVLLSNTGTKLLFRSTDTQTAATLRGLLPMPPLSGRPHIVDVRRPITLVPGECYFVASDGKWGRARVNLGAGRGNPA